MLMGVRKVPIIGGARFNPVAALLSLSPHTLLIPFPQYLAEDEDGSGSVEPNDAVGRVLNLGSSAAHVLQATAGSRPLYKTDGGAHWLESDGTDDALSVTYSALSQTFDDISAWRLLDATPPDPGCYIGGDDPNNYGALFTATDPTSLVIYAGTSLGGSLTAGANVDFVATARYAGAADSRIAVDNGSYTTGNAGTNASTALSLFAGMGGTAQWLQARCYCFARFARALTDGEIALARKAAAALTPSLSL